MATKSAGKDKLYVRNKLLAALQDLAAKHKDFHFDPTEWKFLRTYAKGQGKPVWEMTYTGKNKVKWARLSSLHKAKEFSVSGTIARIARRDVENSILWVEPSSVVGNLYRPQAVDGKSFEQRALGRLSLLAEKVQDLHNEVIDHVEKNPEGPLQSRDATFLHYLFRQTENNLLEAHQHLMSLGIK
jgi:hypothetical protein